MYAKTAPSAGNSSNSSSSSKRPKSGFGCSDILIFFALRTKHLEESRVTSPELTLCNLMHLRPHNTKRRCGHMVNKILINDGKIKETTRAGSVNLWFSIVARVQISPTLSFSHIRISISKGE